VTSNPTMVWDGSFKEEEEKDPKQVLTQGDQMIS
jgi:hypothetical protein